MNRVTVTVRRIVDDAILRVGAEHLRDVERRSGLQVGTFAELHNWPEVALLGTGQLPAGAASAAGDRAGAGSWVVVACGARKLDRPAPARELYTGPLFRSAWAAAVRLGGPAVILSARHGLVDPDEVLAPYNLRLGDRGSVTGAELREQAAALGITEADVVVLGGRQYVELARQVWPAAAAPLAGAGGIGAMRQRLGTLGAA